MKPRRRSSKLRPLIIVAATGLATFGAWALFMAPSSRATPDTPAARNELRRQHLSQLADALAQYQVAQGKLPVSIAATPMPICSATGARCRQAKLLDLNFLATGSTNLLSLPSDPVGGP